MLDRFRCSASQTKACEALKDQMNQKMKLLIIEHCQTFKGLKLKDANHNSQTALHIVR